MNVNEKGLVNRVAQSGLVTIDLEKYYPNADFIDFDLAGFLFQGLILREKEFRKAMEEFDWEHFRNKTLLVNCSVDAIIPKWAYMLIATKASGLAEHVFMGTSVDFIEHHYSVVIRNLNVEDYRDKRIVVKGCGEKYVPTSAYLNLCNVLLPVARSIMYGEPCSTVPVYKRKA